jgi:phosphatidylethanolamine/phosphatidyl-N-methylethanolamine N-methyltransferase
MNSYWGSVLPFFSRACYAGTSPRLELSSGSVAFRRSRKTLGTMPIRQVRPAPAKEPTTPLWSDTARFVLEWLRHPHDTAAIAPSGRALAALMTGEIDNASGPVLELGPGTGVFTRALTRRGVAERDLTLVEQSPSFAKLLKGRFPESTVLNIDAGELRQNGQQASRQFGAAVCGLGLRNMTPLQVEDIIRVSFAVLQPTGSFYLFTYGSRCSVPNDVLKRLNLIAEKVGSTLRNLPPASVYRLRRIGTV